MDASKPLVSSLHFPGLNGVRFLAALAVFIFHTGDLLRYAGLSAPDLPGDLGQKGVVVFFVLSGFLITYLLLAELRKTGTIEVRKFYVRRILRIWPLYYLVIFVAYFLFPHVVAAYAAYQPVFNADFVLFLLLLPNLAGNSTPFVKHTWSVGVEEQFYLLWPWLIKKFRKVLPKTFAAVLFLKIPAVIALDLVIASMNFSLEATYALVRAREVLYSFQIEVMATGGLGAWLLINRRESLLAFVFNPLVERVNLLLLFCIFVTDQGSFQFANDVISVAVTIFIVNVAANEKSLVRLRGAVFDYLGRISYGIYMFHQMVIYLVILFLGKLAFLVGGGLAFDLLLCLSAFVLTIMLASMSYFFFELPFIRLKKKFSVVVNEPRNQAVYSGESG